MKFDKSNLHPFDILPLTFLLYLLVGSSQSIAAQQQWIDLTGPSEIVRILVCLVVSVGVMLTMPLLIKETMDQKRFKLVVIMLLPAVIGFQSLYLYKAAL